MCSLLGLCGSYLSTAQRVVFLVWDKEFCLNGNRVSYVCHDFGILVSQAYQAHAYITKRTVCSMLLLCLQDLHAIDAFAGERSIYRAFRPSLSSTNEGIAARK